MTDKVIVLHNGSALVLSKLVADDLGHWPGKHLTEAETWEAIRANASAGIAYCRLMLMARGDAE